MTVFKVGVSDSQGMKASYNLIIRSTRVIPPGRLLHDPPRHRLKVMQVIALRQERFLCQPLLTLGLLGVLLLDLLLDGAHVDGAQMLGLVEVLV